MKNQRIYQKKGPCFVIILSIIILFIPITQVLASEWTTYQYPNDDYIYDRGNFWYVKNIDADDENNGEVMWYTNWGKAETSHYDFDYDSGAEVLCVRVKVEAYVGGLMGYGKFKAIVYDSANDREWDSAYCNNFNWLGWCTRYVDVAINEIIDPEDFYDDVKIYIRVAKGMYCSVLIDWMKVKIRWES
ncbi:MAG: hypothetical protein ACFFCU_20165 [Promethearchaeota archaeon]